MEIAKTILQQLGGNKFIVMTGSKNFLSDGNALSFRVPAKPANYVKITLKADDTYKMEFHKIHGMKVKLVKEYDEVYCDQLQELFTEVTGMLTKLF